MKELITELAASFNEAWDNLFDFPHPRFMKKVPACPGEYTAAFFPVLGFAAGLVLYLVSWMIFGFSNLYSAAFFSALGSWFVLSFKDSGRGDKALFQALCRRFPQGGASLELSSGGGQWAIMVLRFVILLLCGFNGNFAVLMLVLSGGFALQAALALCEKCQVELLPAGTLAVKYFYISCAVTALLCIWVCEVPALLMVLAVLLIYLAIVKFFAPEEFTGETISFAGSVTEAFLLLISLFF